MTTDTRTVAAVLRLKNPAAMTPIRLNDEIKRGLHITSFNGLAHALEIKTPELRQFITSQRSYQRRLKGGAFNTAESERIYRSAMIWTLAKSIYKDTDTTRRFLMSAHPMLEGRRPLELASDSIVGYEAVEGVLLGLKYGTAA